MGFCYEERGVSAQKILTYVLSDFEKGLKRSWKNRVHTFLKKHAVPSVFITPEKKRHVLQIANSLNFHFRVLVVFPIRYSHGAASAPEDKSRGGGVFIVVWLGKKF